MLFQPLNILQTAISSVSYQSKSEEYKIEKFTKDQMLKLSGSNFFAWRSVQEVILQSHDWYGHVMGSDTCPDPSQGVDKFRRWHKVDQLTQSQLTMNMDFSLFHQLNMRCKMSSELWKTLNDWFGRRSIQASTDASERLRSKKIQVGETMKNHIDELRKLWSEYIEYGGILSDSEWHVIIVRLLSQHPEWKRSIPLANIIVDLEQFISTLELQEMQGYGDVSTTEAALQSQNQPKRTNVNTGRPKLTCTNCSHTGHTAPYCFTPGGGAVHCRPSTYKIPLHMVEKERTNLTAQLSELDKQVASTTLGKESAQLTTVSPAFALMVTEMSLTSSSWLLDSGASSHMTSGRENFVKYSSIEPVTIQMAGKGLTL